VKKAGKKTGKKTGKTAACPAHSGNCRHQEIYRHELGAWFCRQCSVCVASNSKAFDLAVYEGRVDACHHDIAERKGERGEFCCCIKCGVPVAEIMLDVLEEEALASDDKNRITAFQEWRREQEDFPRLPQKKRKPQR